MTQKNISFVPHSDMDIQDAPLVERHKNLIARNKLSEASSLLDNAGYNKGFRAAICNAMQNKLRKIQIYLLNKSAAANEYYSITEPTDEEMEGKTFWLQPIEESEDK
ncbi:MAG: hypothetical protein HDQ99_19425 [Lachnospiraceae bacterium]|nr:hypothetical protein [Lachnospiraceae bacterium]MBD5537776.1 hypothetical protein [Lachnospiraceae bacterium]